MNWGLKFINTFDQIDVFRWMCKMFKQRLLTMAMCVCIYARMYKMCYCVNWKLWCILDGIWTNKKTHQPRTDRLNFKLILKWKLKWCRWEHSNAFHNTHTWCMESGVVWCWRWGKGRNCDNTEGSRGRVEMKVYQKREV